jgi:hypothetical protein
MTRIIRSKADSIISERMNEFSTQVRMSEFYS